MLTKFAASYLLQTRSIGKDMSALGLFVVTIFCTLICGRGQALELNETCPGVCNCIERSVSCFNASLQHIKWRFPRGSINISLRSNNLSQIEPGNLEATFDDLRSLDISSNNFRHLPSVLHQLTQLVHFNASNNVITLDFTVSKMPFHYCTKLETLDLSNNKIQAIGPPFFDGLVDLRNVYLGGNLFTVIGIRYFFDQYRLHTLSLPNGRIEEIYFSFHFNLTVLDLSHNEFEFSEDTKHFELIHGLERLTIGHPKLRYHPPTFTGLDSLYYLRLENFNQDSLRPQILRPLPVLWEFEIHGGSVKSAMVRGKKYLTYITLNNLSHLTTLSLVRCRRLSHGTIKLYDLPQLQTLNINYLESFNVDESFLLLKGVDNLKVLNLSLNFIKRVSFDFLNKFSSLEMLDLSNNKISSLQIPSLLNLTKLRYLNLSGNTLTGFPSEKFLFSNLAVLNLSYNIFNDLTPQFLSKLSNVATCDLSFNLIDSIATTVKSSETFYMLENTWDCKCLVVEILTPNFYQTCRNSSTIFCKLCRMSIKYSGRALFSRADYCVISRKTFPLTVIISIVCVSIFLSIAAAIFFVIKKRNILSCAKKTAQMQTVD